MHGASRLVSTPFFFLFAVLFASARASDLHPLSDALPSTEIELRVQAAEFNGRDAERLECTYRPRRERDVKKERHLHLLGSIWRIGSNDLVTSQREAAHTTHRTVALNDGTAHARVPLHDPEPGYENYQLHSVRLGRLEFQTWSRSAPELSAAFGLVAGADSLRGTFRFDGIAAAPLGGRLPLWPQLRTVDLRVEPTGLPELQLWDESAKHHWDGWRVGTPVYWDSGHSVVHARIDAPTVWVSHAPDPFPRGDAARDSDPAAALRDQRDAVLEIYWPEGESLELPDVRFDREVTVVARRLAALTTEMRELLARANRLRPGVELGTLTSDEWDRFAAATESTDANDGAVLSIQRAESGREVLRVERGALSESWGFVFAAPYDGGRRVRVATLVLHPRPWPGLRPE